MFYTWRRFWEYAAARRIRMERLRCDLPLQAVKIEVVGKKIRLSSAGPLNFLYFEAIFSKAGFGNESFRNAALQSADHILVLYISRTHTAAGNTVFSRTAPVARHLSLHFFAAVTFVLGEYTTERLAGMNG